MYAFAAYVKVLGVLHWGKLPKLIISFISLTCKYIIIIEAFFNLHKSIIFNIKTPFIETAEPHFAWIISIWLCKYSFCARVFKFHGIFPINEADEDGF